MRGALRLCRYLMLFLVSYALNNRIIWKKSDWGWGESKATEAIRGTKKANSPQFKHIGRGGWAGSRKSSLASARLLPDYTVLTGASVRLKQSRPPTCLTCQVKIPPPHLRLLRIRTAWQPRPISPHRPCSTGAHPPPEIPPISAYS